MQCGASQLLGIPGVIQQGKISVYNQAKTKTGIFFVQYNKEADFRQIKDNDISGAIEQGGGQTLQAHEINNQKLASCCHRW